MARPVANGLLHLPTGDLYPCTPSYFGLTASEVVFDPAAPVPQHWLAFLSDLWKEDAEAIVTLQDWFGYTLSSDTSPPLRAARPRWSVRAAPARAR